GEGEQPPLSTTEALPTRPQVELRELDVGSYLARVYAFDENGTVSQESQPRRFLLARIAGLGQDGTIRVEAGQMPRLNAPSGLQSSMLLDGNVPGPGMPSGGAHQLRVMVAGLSAEVPLVASGQASAQVSDPSQPAYQPTEQSADQPTEQSGDG